ncbi:MAG: aminotransferase class IV [Clostridia bacterium]|nr:aminotransferase class IV [Clostridia bacterium]
MKNLGYYNGRIGLIEEMTVPMNDRAGYFGDGIYDATYSRNHIIYALDEHIDRFFNSARAVGMDVPMSKEALSSLLCDLVRRVDDGEQFVYWQLTRGTSPRNHVFPDVPPNLWVMLKPASVKDTYERVRLITIEDTRFYHCNIKTLNLLPNVLAAQQAELAGAQESVFHRGDRVTECAHSNVHIIRNETLITAPTDNLILPGIARAHIIAAANMLGYAVEERPFTVAEMMTADEIMISSAGSFCIAADAIDGIPVGGRSPEMLRRLQDFLVADWLRKTE